MDEEMTDEAAGRKLETHFNQIYFKMLQSSSCTKDPKVSCSGFRSNLTPIPVYFLTIMCEI